MKKYFDNLKIISIAFIGLFIALPLQAQNLDFMSNGGKSKEPLLVEADKGIEWDSTKKAYIAKKNAKAHKGDVVVRADEIAAYYRENSLGSTEVWQLEAHGHVVISTPEDVLKADRAVYNVDSQIFIATGKNLILTRPKMIITARDSFEYWEKTKMAVARGNAKVVQDGDQITAETIASYFEKNNKGKTVLNRVEAFDDIRILTENRVIDGNKGIYHAKQRKAMVFENVKITQGKNQLNGDYAEMDLETGVSRLLRGSQANSEQVRGLIIPKTLEEDKKKNK